MSTRQVASRSRPAALAQRALDLDPKHVLVIRLVTSVQLRRRDVTSVLEGILSGAAVAGLPDQALTDLSQIVAEMRRVYPRVGFFGLTQYMADAVKDPRLEFDTFLKLASRRAVLYGDAGRLDEAFDCLDEAIASCDPALVYLAVAPQWDSLREDPRFGERLKQLALA